MSTWSACRAHAIGYKGMVLPERLAQFYPDLQRAELASSAVVFHQRFSTNTAPRWPLAQPFRLLAHNGEINTIAGNRAWAQARAHAWRTPSLDLPEFDPVIESTAPTRSRSTTCSSCCRPAAWTC